jgi:hypothetical protein
MPGWLSAVLIFELFSSSPASSSSSSSTSSSVVEIAVVIVAVIVAVIIVVIEVVGVVGIVITATAIAIVVVVRKQCPSQHRSEWPARNQLSVERRAMSKHTKRLGRTPWHIPLGNVRIEQDASVKHVLHFGGV